MIDFYQREYENGVPYNSTHYVKVLPNPSNDFTNSLIC